MRRLTILDVTRLPCGAPPSAMRTTMARRLFPLVFLPMAAALAQSTTPKIVSAANAFLSTLDQKQRQSVLFAFDDSQQRVRWSNLPTSIVKRA